MKKKGKFSLKTALYSLLLALCLFIYVNKPPSETEIQSSVVRIDGAHGMCSGEQVQAPSGQVYVLTAAHCRILGDHGTYLVTSEDGRMEQRREIEEDPYSDLLLLEGMANVPALKLAPELLPERHTHVRTFTHGSALNTYKTEGELIQQMRVSIMLEELLTPEQEDHCSHMPKYNKEEIDFFGPHKICVMTTEEIISTAKVVPGSSGGPVVDDHGRLIGVVSASDGNFSLFVSPLDINRFLRAY